MSYTANGRGTGKEKIMSYAVNGGGTFFISKLTKKKEKKILEAAEQYRKKCVTALNEPIGSINEIPDPHGGNIRYSVCGIDVNVNLDGRMYVYLGSDEYFVSVSYEEWLDTFASFFDAGELRYIGEDGEMWRYVIDHTMSGGWREDKGDVTYAITVKDKLAELVSLIEAESGKNAFSDENADIGEISEADSNVPNDFHRQHINDALAAMKTLLTDMKVSNPMPKGRGLRDESSESPY